MCRFNLILTRDERAVRILESNGYQRMFESLHGNEAYQKGYCNCGSCVGGLIDKKGRTFEEAIEDTNKERLERLYLIKEFMNQPGYEERKKVYNRTVEELFQAMIQHQQEDIMEVNPEYNTSAEMLRKYQLENDLMRDSICYFRTEEEENSERSTGIPLNQIIELPEELVLKNMTSEDTLSNNIIEATMEPESFVIDAVITRTEKNNYKNYRDEFEEYSYLFRDILIEVPEIIFATIWSEPDNMKIIKSIPIDSFRIEDLVYLNYNEMILVRGNGTFPSR